MTARSLLALAALAALAACAPADPDDTALDSDDAVVDAPIDAGVNSWVPDDLKPVEPVRIVFLGDSITDGSGASRESLNYRNLLQVNDSDKWEGFDDVDLETSYPSITEVVDVSFGGATTDTLIATQLPALKRKLEAAGGLPAERETVVVFTIGGNDAQQALNPFSDAHAIVQHALDNMAVIVDQLNDPELFAEPPRIYATNIYEPTDGTGHADDCFFGVDFSSAMPELEYYNGAFRDLAEQEGFAAVDLRGDFLGHGYSHDDRSLEAYDADDPTLWFADDCIHPNNRGHHELRRLFHAAILGEPLRVVLPKKG